MQDKNEKVKFQNPRKEFEESETQSLNGIVWLKLKKRENIKFF